MSDSTHRPTSLLVVEAEPDRLEALREYLRSRDEDTELYSAGELAVALERLSSGGVDAVILDPDLPDSQGIVRFERMYAFAPSVPVIVLTSVLAGLGFSALRENRARWSKIMRVLAVVLLALTPALYAVVPEVARRADVGDCVESYNDVRQPCRADHQRNGDEKNVQRRLVNEGLRVL